MLTKLTSKNQITLPRQIIKAFKEIEYFDAEIENGRIVLVPVRIRPADADLAGIREKMKKLGIHGKDVAEAVRWSRKSPE